MLDMVLYLLSQTRLKKRKINGSKQEQAKTRKLSSHITGPDCKFKRLKCFETVKVENRALLIDSFNALPTKNAQVSGFSQCGFSLHFGL